MIAYLIVCMLTDKHDAQYSNLVRSVSSLCFFSRFIACVRFFSRLIWLFIDFRKKKKSENQRINVKCVMYVCLCVCMFVCTFDFNTLNKTRYDLSNKYFISFIYNFEYFTFFSHLFFFFFRN